MNVNKGMYTNTSTNMERIRLWIRIWMYVHSHALEMESPYERQVSAYDDDITISHLVLFYYVVHYASILILTMLYILSTFFVLTSFCLWTLRHARRCTGRQD